MIEGVVALWLALVATLAAFLVVVILAVAVLLSMADDE